MENRVSVEVVEKVPSKRSARVSARKQQRNAPIRSRAKTLVKNARKLVLSDDEEAAKRAVADGVVALDKAAQKGVIHPNNAARRKSRLEKMLNRSTE